MTLIDALWDVIFPVRCLGCGRRGSWLCDRCQRLAPRLPTDHCAICGRPSAGPVFCPACQLATPEIDSLWCAFRFDGAVRRAIHLLKYRGARHLAKPLALELLPAVDRLARPAVIVPIPLHPRRLAERGYNQSALIARALGHASGLPVREDVLRRVRDAAPQVSRSGAERWQNVRDAFASTHGVSNGTSVVLIDDVATTGSTLRAAGAALKAAGVARVDAITLARTV